MACRRGCIMGGGQPVDAHSAGGEARAKGLYAADVNTQIKKSNENPLVQSLYDGLLKGKEHKLASSQLQQTFTVAYTKPTYSVAII